MGLFLNRGNEEFKQAVNSEIYLDKTGTIEVFDDLIGTEQRYACVSRPRRFGKSITANMPAAFFERGCDSRALFENREIARRPDWDRNLNKYDVIRIDIADIRSRRNTPEEALDYIDEKVIKELDAAYPGFVPENCGSIADALAEINEANGAQFIIIIDEWDCFFRDERSNKSVQDRYINLLRGLFKGNSSKKFTALAYITGILPIKKYNSESALNNFYEYTMTDPARLAKYIGFTEDEVKGLCEKYEMDYEQVCSWYDGYSFPRAKHIFGPNSVVRAMLSGSCKNYWSQTVAFNSLATYIGMNFDGLKDAILSMMAGNRERVRVRTYANDMVSFRSKDDVMTMLIHLGYLAYDELTEEAYIPNKEVRMCFEDTLTATDWTEVVESIDASEKLLKSLAKGDAEAVAAGLEECHRKNTSILKYNDENSLAVSIGLAFYSARKEYEVVREMPAGEGFADMVFVPKYNCTKPPMIIELKWDQTAETAISQIKNKHYPECLGDYRGEVLLVGVSYEKDGPEAKKHRCVIEKYLHIATK